MNSRFITGVSCSSRSVVCVLTTLTALNPINIVFAGDTYSRLDKEIRRFIDSSKVSVVTVTSRFSHEVGVEQETGILSFFKSEVKKQPFSYVNVGTGIILDQAGHVVTRSSIVLGADDHAVAMADGRELTAKFIGHDAETGFSVLKIEERGTFKPAFLARDEIEITPGSSTVMIGNSLGAFPSIFLGTLNGVMQDGMIQISVNLNPGGNGSPIYNLKGEVIGVVAGRLNLQQNFPPQALGFHYNEPTLAYPIHWISRIVEDIIDFGHVRKGWLGVVGYYDGNKPKIREIKKNSPAQHAGLVEGDVIVKYSNKNVNNISELVHLVERTPPGKRVAIEFQRKDRVIRRDIEIGEKTVRSGDVKKDSFIGMGGPTEKGVIQTDFRSLIERDRLLEIRINHLEKEIEKLKALLKSR